MTRGNHRDLSVVSNATISMLAFQTLKCTNFYVTGTSTSLGLHIFNVLFNKNHSRPPTVYYRPFHIAIQI